MNQAELKERVAAIRWFHTIDLGGGVVTPGWDNTPRKLRTIGLPQSLAGKSVLDIGAWDGFFSFECERRGASRVLATDFFCWGGGGWGTRAGFDLARQHFGSRVEDLRIDVPDLSPESCGVFDVVLFLGVLYHLRDPFGALERIGKVTAEMLIVETVCDFIGTSDPVMAFYPGKELSGDPTNWWGPNPAAVEAMLQVAGFRRVKRHYVQPAAERAVFALSQAYRKKARFLPTLRQGRAVFHAWRR